MKVPTQTKTQVEQGNYRATLYRIVYIGTTETEYKGEKKSSFKVHLTWELNDETKVFKEGDEPKPLVVSQKYTYSMGSKSNLRPIVEGMVGGLTDAVASNFDLDTLLGKSCMLQVIHGTSETGKPKMIYSTSQMPKGMPAPESFNEWVLLSYEDWSDEVFSKLPQWIQDEIRTTPEYQTVTGQYDSNLSLEDQELLARATKKPEHENPNDSIPF